MIDMQVTVDARVVSAAMNRLGRQVPRELQKVSEEYADKALVLIRRNASGRPGPNAPTGDYRRSWTKRAKLNGAYVVGTNAPQGRRLEHGFHGADSLGRLYRQRAFPHVLPTYRVIGPQYRRAVVKRIQELARGAA